MGYQSDRVRSGTVANYGLLSSEARIIDARELVFCGVSLRGFWLLRWFAETALGEVAVLDRALAKLK